MPVLFLPGNGGSKAQGRSVASEAARQAARTYASVRLAFFVAHFQGELSALDASTVERQAQYAMRCMFWMHDALQARLILLIGHSMGAAHFCFRLLR